MDVDGIAQSGLGLCGAKAVERLWATGKLGYEGSATTCPCGGVARFVGYRTRQVAALVGPIRIRRAYYRGGTCGATPLLYDARAGLGDLATSERPSGTVRARRPPPVGLAGWGRYALQGGSGVSSEGSASRRRRPFGCGINLIN